MLDSNGDMKEVSIALFPCVSTMKTSALGNGSPRKLPESVIDPKPSSTRKSRRLSISGDPGTRGLDPAVVKVMNKLRRLTSSH